jgi:hypothetical protein
MREELVENDAEGIDVAACIDRQRISKHLLGAHVSKCAEYLTHVRLPRRLGIGVGGASQSEIKDLWLAGFIDQDIAGFEVAMNNAALMRVLDRLANGDHQIEALASAELVIVGVPDQRQPVDQFHGEVRLHTEGCVGGPRFVNLRDVGMMEPSQNLRLLLEAPDQIAAGPAGSDDLESDQPARLLLFGFIHGAHAAFAEKTQDAISANASGKRRVLLAY